MARSKYDGGAFRLQVVERDARPLVTVGPEHAYWRLEPGQAVELPESVRGALVRIQPPPGATRAQVDALEASLRAGGAEALRTAPWAKEACLQPTARVRVHEQAGVREVAIEMAMQSPRAPELVPLVDELLAAQGA